MNDKKSVPYSPIEDFFIRNHYLEMTYWQIGQRLGRNAESVKKRKAYLGLPSKKRKVKGSKLQVENTNTITNNNHSPL